MNGHRRTRDDAVIQRRKGKACAVNPEWRTKLDEIAGIVEGIRSKFSKALGLNRMLYEFGRFGRPSDIEDMMALSDTTACSEHGWTSNEEGPLS